MKNKGDWNMTNKGDWNMTNRGEYVSFMNKAWCFQKEQMNYSELHLQIIEMCSDKDG